MHTVDVPASTRWRSVSSESTLPLTRRVDAERDERARVERELRRRAPEELVVLRVRAGPAGLDVVDAEPVELLGDAQLVVDGERDALELRAVAQRRVVDLDPGRPARVTYAGSVVNGHARTSPCTVDLAADRGEVRLLELPGHLAAARRSRGRRPSGRHHLGRGAVEEHLVGDVEVAAERAARSRTVDTRGHGAIVMTESLGDALERARRDAAG